MNTHKIDQLGDFLSLFNFPPSPQATMPQMQVTQVPPGGQQSGNPGLPQGMVQVNTAPPGLPSATQAPMAPQQQYAQPQSPPPPQYQQTHSPQPPQQPAYDPAQHSQQQQTNPAPQPENGSSNPASELLQQNESYRAQLAKYEEERRQQEEQRRQQELASMKPLERMDAKLDLLHRSTQIATERAQQYHLAYEREKIMNEYGRELDPSKLDMSSVEALQASVPAARQGYMELENRVASKLAAQYGIQNHINVEGLPPAPSIHGLPTPNGAGAVPSIPGGQQQQQQAVHPQLAASNWTQRQPNPSYGRVVQPQPVGMPSPGAPPAQGQYFPPQYHQPQHMQQQSPQVQFVPQQQYQQQPAQMAPQQADITAAQDEARNAIQAARRGGMSRLAAMGMGEAPHQAQANSNQGAHKISHANLPDAAMFAHGPNSHPMHLASGGI